MKLKLFLALALVLLSAGCAPVDSLNPLYTEKDVVFDEALLGQWGTPEDGLNFARMGKDGYSLVTFGKDDTTGQTMSLAFEAHLVSLQGHRFLDLKYKQAAAVDESQALPEVHFTRTRDGLEIEPRLVSAGEGAYLEFLPGESHADQDRFSVRLRPAHEFFKLVMEEEGRTLKLIQLDNSWIDNQVREGKLQIDHEVMEGGSAVLTAETPDLQQLVLDHVDDNEAFRGETIVKRPEP
jgi:hypothetical protein